MIRINLLAVKRKKKSQPLPQFIIHAVIILAVTVIGLGLFTFNLSSKISDRKSKKAFKEKKLIELAEQLKEVESYEKDNEAFQKKNEVIKQLKRNQDIPLRLLDELSSLLPEGIWLTEINDKAGAVTISGYAFSNTELVSYVQSLKNSKYMTDVALLESRQKKVGDSLLYEFKLTLKVKV